MKTLIELYDERPLENVLSSLVFTPERTVFICEKETAEDGRALKTIKSYFAHRGISTDVVMLAADRYSAKAMLDALRRSVDTCPDCVLDITGGTDQALFAAGILFAEKNIPAFTWSRRNNAFYSISNAPFASPLKNPLSLSIEDHFLMAGGSIRQGRVDNSVLVNYLKFFKPFFDVYLRFKKEWTGLIGWMQKVSAPINNEICLDVDAPLTVNGERGPVTVDPDVLVSLHKIGFLKEFRLASDRVCFRFRDAQIRTWLRDTGSVLETYVYKLCLDAGTFTDVATSVIVDWESDVKQNSVSNEIDVMAARGVTPVFISCKTCEIKTEALNELSILKERFGGEMSRAAIVTATKVQTVTRRRARELDIDVIELDDLRTGRASEIIKSLAK